MIEDRWYYEQMLRIRRFEETVLEEFKRGVFTGTTHTYLGQEANAVALLSLMMPMDVVVSNHRCHGHFLAYGGDPRALFAELMGKDTGVCGGVGGSQHLHWRNFYSNGILGGMAPVSAGMALAEKTRGSQAVVIVFLGDGAMGQGVVYESMNLAALWKLPVLYVVEHNHIAQTTPTEMALSGTFRDRFAAFGIPAVEVDSSDVLEIAPLAGKCLFETRAKKIPHALILQTVRFGPHSKGDDTRDPQRMAALIHDRDPLKIHGARLEANERDLIHRKVDGEIALAFQTALADPFPVAGRRAI